MPEITLKKPLTHEGKTYEVLDFDPSLNALKAFDKAIESGVSEFDALQALFAHDGDFPAELVGALRMSDIMKLTAAATTGPFGEGSPVSEAGEAAPPT